MSHYFIGKFKQALRSCFEFIVNQKWIAKNPFEHRGTEARRNKYIEKVKTIEPDFYSVNSVLSKKIKLCVFVSLCSIPFFANQFCSTISCDDLG